MKQFIVIRRFAFKKTHYSCPKKIIKEAVLILKGQFEIQFRSIEPLVCTQVFSHSVDLSDVDSNWIPKFNNLFELFSCKIQSYLWTYSRFRNEYSLLIKEPHNHQRYLRNTAVFVLISCFIKAPAYFARSFPTDTVDLVGVRVPVWVRQIIKKVEFNEVHEPVFYFRPYEEIINIPMAREIDSSQLDDSGDFVVPIP